ncbi:DUF6798 domain-containing protein [Aquisphaera giovannonii]|nr:DUF6798 domain-containing protein [Aquisphaera giovannonii]
MSSTDATGGVPAAEDGAGDAWPIWPAYILILGVYLTLRGYHSLDGDQAYRLPLLLHQQEPSVYAADPFVLAFESFNPHRGSQAVLGASCRVLGLSAGLLALFVATFLATCRGLDRLARSAWPGTQAGAVGLVAIVLVLTAKAGSLGTNHLFEAMVLDRLMALAAGWLAVAAAVGRPESGWWRAGPPLLLAAIIHPSLGLQLALLVAGSWIAWAATRGRAAVGWGLAGRGILVATAAVLPGLAINVASGGAIAEGLSADDFWTLAVELQGPQHMLPHLWRMPQWLAGACFPALAALSLRGAWSSAPGRRLVLMLGMAMLWLAAAWAAIEALHSLRVTIFQPFRMATVTRGLCLVLIAGRLVSLWARGTWLDRLRAILVGVGVMGDWMLVAVTLAELAATVSGTDFVRRPRRPWLARWPGGAGSHGLAQGLVYAAMLAMGLFYLSRHDTESGQRVILVVSIGWGGIAIWRLARGASALRLTHPTREGIQKVAMVAAWAVPAAALLAGLVPADSTLGRSSAVRGLVARCRFAAVPVDDFERLGAWCRRNTPADATFVGPPGPKTFRLWSRRSLAFNRSGSPYHAAGLADWFARFQDHVGRHIPPAEFAREYLSGRHRLESRYDAMTADELAALARRQGADHVLATADDRMIPAGGPLELLHVEGRHAVYRLRPELASRAGSEDGPHRHR